MIESTVIFDTNILIYYLNNQGGEAFFSRFTAAVKSGAGISVITRIETLGWRGHNAETIKETTTLLALLMEWPLSESVIQCCIELRQSLNIKFPDAIIASTALITGLPLMTRNTVDFREIPGLLLIDPFIG